MQHNEQFEQLKENSLHIEEGMPVRWPKLERVGQLKPSVIIQTINNPKAYAIRGKVIAYVADGQMYVTPRTTQALQTLRSANYRNFEFHVPFASGDLPQGEYLDKWHAIIAKVASSVTPQPAVAAAV